MATVSPSRSRSPRRPSASAAAISRFQLARDAQRGREQILRHIGLVGKIDARFDQRQRLDQPLPPAFRRLGERALQLAQRLPPLAFGLRHDQVGEAFDRSQIELAVLEGAAGELASLGRAQAGQARKRSKRRRDHGAAAVQLQLGCVLAGLAVGPGKPQDQRLVDDLFGLRIAHAGERGFARGRELAGQLFERLAGERPGNAHHRDRRRRAAGGEGEDGVALRLGHRGAGERRRTEGSRGDVNPHDNTAGHAIIRAHWETKCRKSKLRSTTPRPTSA